MPSLAISAAVAALSDFSFAPRFGFCLPNLALPRLRIQCGLDFGYGMKFVEAVPRVAKK